MTKTTTPEDLITSDHEFMMRNIRHGALAPKAAGDRWQAVQAVAAEMDRLSDLYYQRAEAFEDIRADAVAANARAADSGKAAPAGTGAKVMDAELAVAGTLAAYKAALPRLAAARKAYDALFADRAFITEYRDALSSEFVKRHESAVKAFRELDSQVPALAELYGLLGDFTLNGLLGDTVREIEFNGSTLANGGTFTGSGVKSWDAPKLSEAMSTVRGYVLNGDPVYGGTLLAEDLDAIAAALPGLAEQRYDEWQEELANNAPMRMVGGSPWRI
ncbi:hypothetical protein OG612_18635 [Streptomyces sp. NBC_01527]|uniref:hypothetical protein n=1 Tax=Streptomyces sp. NBC_01527 TaxID=2903894 RepID=UPI00386AF7F6